MKIEKKYPESLINAFLTSFKASEVMKLANISKTKYYKLKKDENFQKILTDRRNEMIKEAVNKMESYLSEDVDILQNMARDSLIKDQIRINAIQLLMNQLGQWKQITEIISRIEALEEANNKQQKQKDKKRLFRGCVC